MKVLPTLEPSFNLGPCNSTRIFMERHARSYHPYNPYIPSKKPSIQRQTLPELPPISSMNLPMNSCFVQSSDTDHVLPSLIQPKLLAQQPNHQPITQFKEIIYCNQNVKHERRNPSYQTIEMSAPSKETCNPELRQGIWLAEEHEQFLKGFALHGNDWKKLSEEFVKTRTRSQLASHSQKYFSKLKKAEALSGKAKEVLARKTRSLYSVL